MNLIRVRVRESGQVLDMVPDVARAMIAGGTAVSVGQVAESAMVKPAQNVMKQRPAARVTGKVR